MVSERVSTVEKVIVGKLEYHERHDDSRFGAIRDDLSDIRIRNASKDALMATVLTKLERKE